MSGQTPGTWRAVDGRILPDNYVLEGAPIATVHARKKTGMQEADARLIAAAPDHAAIAWAVCSGIARWDSFRTSDGGEFCINGLRHATKLDEFGVPVMTGGMRAAIAAATGDSHE